MRKKLIAAASALAACGALMSASPSMAASGGEVGVLVARYIRVPSGTWYCQDIGNGDVCVRYINNYTGIDVKYVKRAGGTITVRFHAANHAEGLATGSSAWGTQSAGQTNSAPFNNSSLVKPPNNPDCIKGTLEVQSQGRFYSPMISKGSTLC